MDETVREITEKTDLSKREAQILIYKNEGLTLKEISQKIDVKYNTVKGYYDRLKKDIRKNLKTVEAAKKYGWMEKDYKAFEDIEI